MNVQSKILFLNTCSTWS